MMFRMYKYLCLTLLSFSVIIQTNHGALFRRILHITPGEPQICRYRNAILAVGETYDDLETCVRYACDKSTNANEYVLTVMTCGLVTITADKPCSHSYPKQGTPYPECCNPKVICPPGE